MPCYYPQRTYASKYVNPSGLRSRTWSVREALDSSDWIDLPCGNCIGCRLESSRQVAVRSVLEASLYEDNCFLTLTYSNDFLPKSGSLSRRDIQLFVKRLRRYVLEKWGVKCRVVYCGEYGEVSFRPHYHLLVFGFDFVDKFRQGTTKGGLPDFGSHILCTLWPFGRVSVGELNFNSAAYVGRYITKKVKGRHADKYYSDLGVVPEFLQTPKRPGLGYDWLLRFLNDVYPSDEVRTRDIVMKPPKFFDGKFKLLSPAAWESISFKRVDAARAALHDNSRERLDVKEFLTLSKQKFRRSVV